MVDSPYLPPSLVCVLQSLSWAAFSPLSLKQRFPIFLNHGMPENDYVCVAQWREVVGIYSSEQIVGSWWGRTPGGLRSIAPCMGISALATAILDLPWGSARSPGSSGYPLGFSCPGSTDDFTCLAPVQCFPVFPLHSCTPTHYWTCSLPCLKMPPLDSAQTVNSFSASILPLSTFVI